MYRLLMVGILGLSVMTLTACESMTGKTAGRTIDDATTPRSVSTLIRVKFDALSLVNFP